MSIVIGLLVFGLMATANTAHNLAPNNANNCLTQYQAALQQALDLKETCSEAVYKDCCEVHI